MALTQRHRKDQPVNLRLSKNQRDIIDQAASISGRSRTEFMVEASYREAEDVLLDRVMYPLDSEEYDRFLQILEEPVEPTRALRDLLHSRSPWEE